MADERAPTKRGTKSGEFALVVPPVAQKTGIVIYGNQRYAPHELARFHFS